MTLNDLYWERVGRLPNPSPALKRYIAGKGGPELWGALTADEQAKCQHIRDVAREDYLREEKE